LLLDAARARTVTGIVTQARELTCDARRQPRGTDPIALGRATRTR
jgi:hypothetical protein